MSSTGSEPVAASSDHSLVQRYRDGSQGAATELYIRYAQRLRGLARAQISPELARKVEVDDIMQSVFGSLFRGISHALYDVPAGEELWKLILVIALHKIRSQGSYHHAARRDSRRTCSGSAAEALLQSQVEEDSAAGTFLQIVTAEALERMTIPQRQMVQLRMDGLDVPQIAHRTGRSKRTVERLLQQARAQLNNFLHKG